MTALLSFIILLSYILYAGVAESLSATYYKVKKPYLFQVALGLAGFLMMIYLLDMTAGKWYQFLSFFATSALIFVAFAPDYKNMLEGKVHVAAAMVSAVAGVLLVSLMGYWWVVLCFLTLALLIIQRNGNKTYWLEMAVFASVFVGVILRTLAVGILNF